MSSIQQSIRSPVPGVQPLQGIAPRGSTVSLDSTVLDLPNFGLNNNDRAFADFMRNSKDQASREEPNRNSLDYNQPVTLGREDFRFSNSPSEMIDILIDPVTKEVKYQVRKSELDRLKDELHQSNQKVRSLEHQLAKETNAGRQAQNVNRQIEMFEERLQRLTVVIEAKDREIENLRKALAVASKSQTIGQSDEGDKVEILR